MREIKKLTYCSWEGLPAVLVRFDDGSPTYGFTHADGAWKDSEAADIATKASVIGKEAFMKQFPLVALPIFPK
jgi:hypothetical protein